MEAPGDLGLDRSPERHIDTSDHVAAWSPSVAMLENSASILASDPTLAQSLLGRFDEIHGMYVSPAKNSGNEIDGMSEHFAILSRPAGSQEILWKCGNCLHSIHANGKSTEPGHGPSLVMQSPKG